MSTIRSLSTSKALATLLILGAVLFFGFYAGRSSAAAPAGTPAPPKPAPQHLEKAVEFLNKAKAELEAADPDRGGNRTEAIRLVTDAIARAEKAIRFQAKP